MKPQSKREIKFRMFDTRLKQMVFTGYHVIGEVTAFGGMEIHINETRHLTPECENSMDRWNDFVEMQFLEFQDRKGNDVYDGDILMVISDNDNEEYITKVSGSMLNGLITHNEKLCVDMVLYDYSIYTKNSEVIGNIYENPELIPA